MAPFSNNQNLFAFKDDYSGVFGKHFVKVGGIFSYNQKNEDVFDQGSAESSLFGSCRRPDGERRQPPATRSPTCC